MCRSIKTLFNFDPPATDEEVRGAALQFVRNLSGFNTPSKVNKFAFGYAVDEAFEVARRLINRLETSASTRNRGGSGEGEAARGRAVWAAGFGLRSSNLATQRGAIFQILARTSAAPSRISLVGPLMYSDHSLTSQNSAPRVRPNDPGHTTQRKYYQGSAHHAGIDTWRQRNDVRYGATASRRPEAKWRSAANVGPFWATQIPCR